VQQELALLVSQAGQRVEAMRGDVANPASCAAIVQQSLELLPDITILVNNAGVYGPMGLIEEIDWNDWVEAIQINLFGVVLMCRQVIPLMRARGYGKIINLSGGGA